MAKLQITIDAKDAERAIKALKKDFIGFEKHVESAETSVGTFSTNTTRMLKGVGAAVAGAFAVDQLIRFSKYALEVADRYTTIDAKVKLATDSQEDFNKSYEELYELTKDTGTVMDINVQGFSKLSFAMRDVPSGEIIDYLETVNKSLTVAGAGAAESSSFMLQWSQAMGSGVVAGDELRAMIESNSYFMGLLAEELGTTINGLKKMGSEGTLTTEKFTKAMKAVADTVNEDFGNIPVTVEKALASLKTVWESIVADANRGSGASFELVTAIQSFATIIEENRDGIIGFFTAIADAAGWAAERVANFGNAYAGLKAYKAGDISFWEFASAGPEEMDKLLKKVEESKTGYGELKDKVGELNRELYKTNQLDPWGAEGKAEKDAAIQSIKEQRQAVWDEIDRIEEGIDAELELAFDLTVDADTSGAEDSLQQLSDMQKEHAIEWVKQHEKATEKMIEKMGEKIKQMNEDIIDSTKDFADELRDLQREGMNDEDAWNDLNSQMDEYKQKAAKAAKAGNWAEQADYLDRIKGLLSSMPDSVQETVSAEDVARAKQIYEYQLRITRGGKNAYGDAKKPFEDAKKEYEALLQAQKDGYRTVISEEDVLKAKIQETKDINDQILENKKNQVDATEEEKNNLETALRDYKDLASGATDATGELVDGVVEVGEGWEEVGDTWQRVSGDIVDNVQGITRELDTAISKMNELNSGSSGGGNYGGARALGGPVSAGKEYLVGEKGPERFTPSVSGYITPNDKLNAGSKGERLVDINLSIDGGPGVPLQGKQTSLDELERQIEEKRRYAA